jgi:hypothetical protein
MSTKKKKKFTRRARRVSPQKDAASSFLRGPVGEWVFYISPEILEAPPSKSSPGQKLSQTQPIARARRTKKGIEIVFLPEVIETFLKSPSFTRPLPTRPIGVEAAFSALILPIPYPAAISGKNPKSKSARSAWFYWSERRDLNSGPPVPQTGALTGLRYAPSQAATITATV